MEKNDSKNDFIYQKVADAFVTAYKDVKNSTAGTLNAHFREFANYMYNPNAT